jgi:wobble nucleotide-excising tRNase
MGGDCPYCGQSTGLSELMEHYSEYFNQEYTHALQTLHDFRTAALESLSIGSLVSLGRLIAENDNRHEYWSKLSVEGLEAAQFEIDDLQVILVELSSEIESVLNKKLSDPLTVIELPQKLSETLDSLQTKLGELKSYNSVMRGNNTIIATFKNSLMESDDTAAVSDRLNAAKDRRTRYTTAVTAFCTEYGTLCDKKKRLEREKVKLREQLDGASVELIGQHQNAINDCLRKSGASFTLQRIEHGHTGGKPNSTFVLEINGEEIAADAAAQDAPNLKTALSAGDKTTLAFAFFVSRAAQDTNLSATTLVVDDPISSLDAGRRGHTLNTIFNLFSNSAQGILLSHDPDFLHGLWQRMGAAPEDRTAFQIMRTGSRASKLEKWDVEKQTESEQKVRMQVIQTFVDAGLEPGQHLDDIVRIIRPTLEHVYKATFPKEIPSAESLGNFIGNVTKSNEQYLVNIKTRLPRIIAINNFVVPFSSHDSSGFVPPLNEIEVNTYAKDALDLLRS